MLSGFATNEHNHKWQVIVMFSFTTFVIFPLLLAKFPPSLHLCICLYWRRIFGINVMGFYQPDALRGLALLFLYLLPDF